MTTIKIVHESVHERGFHSVVDEYLSANIDYKIIKAKCDRYTPVLSDNPVFDYKIQILVL